MDDKELETLQAEEALATTNPEAYALSNPTPRDWTMSAQDIARSIKINPIEALTTKYQREGPENLNWLETVGAGIWDSIKTGVQDIDESAKVAGISYTSPNMTQDEAERLMQDALYTRHFLRQARQADTAEKIKYKKTYDFSNAVGSAIKYAGLGFVTGSPAAIGAIAGLESAAGMEADLVDRYIEATGDIEGYTKDDRAKDLGIAGAYGVFTGITESMLGVERLATGALGRYSTLEAMSRLARMEGKLTKSGLLKAARRLGMSAIEEGSEEFVQSIGEDLANAIAGYGEELGTDESFKKAVTSAIYGAIIGGGMGWGLYRYNRKSIVDKINRWNTERKAGLNEYQITEVADQILDDGKTQMLDEIATRVEIRNQYGQAFDTVKQRIKEIVEATGTTPWTDQNKTIDEYVQTVAETVTLPAIIQANRAGLPLSEFLDIANMQVVDTANGKAPILLFQPIESIDDLRALLDKQNAIIKEQTDAAKLGNETPGEKEKAQRRKAILQYQIRAWERANRAENARRTRRKEEADYITAKDLQPEQVSTLDNAVTAEPGQEYVLFAGKRIPVEYQVVELAEVQPSHINGEPNPNYTNTELQNRASRGTTQDVADLREKATNITPERLLRANTAAEGAPVVNARGEVIAGNGRAEIVRYAYENPETAQTYRTAIENAGFKTEGLQQPILIRRNTTLTDQEQVAAADISNISETSAFDEASQARRDTQYLKDSTTPTDFAAKLPMSERRGLMQNNGRWNKRQVQHRYEDALLSWLCGNDTQLFEALVLDGKIPQKVLDVLTANGNLIYDTATRFPETGLREDIYHALQKMQMATKDNFLELTQQISLDGRDVMAENILIWNWLYADTTTNRQFMSNYATTLATNHEQVANGQDMFGQKVAPISKKDALMRALKTTDEERAQAAATRGREYEPLFTQETGEVKNPELAAAIASYENQFAPQAQPQNQILNQAQFDIADTNARLDQIYPEYTGETIEVDGKERTVYNSNGERIAKSAEALRNFWNWFGNSKAVDNQGRPLVLYHGSPFHTIKEFMYPESQTYTRGIFFIDDKTVASTFAYTHGKVYPVYLKIDDPQVFDEHGENWDDDLEYKWYEQTPKSKDGIIVKNVVEAPAHNDTPANDYIVFNNKQIKSVENRGTYGPETANIYNQLAYTSGAQYYNRPSTAYVLRGGEGQIVHGWGVYFLADKDINVRRYRQGQFAGQFFYIPNMPETPQQDTIKLPDGYTGTEIPRLAKDLTDEQNIKLHEQLQIIGAGYLADYAAKAQPYEKVDSFFRQIRAILIAKADSDTWAKANNVYTLMTALLGKKESDIATIYPDIKDYKDELPTVIQNVIDTALRMFNTRVDRLTVGQLQRAFEEYAKKHNITQEYLTPDVLDSIAGDQTQDYKNKLKELLVKTMDGKNPLWQPFDNSIFEGVEVESINDLKSDRLNNFAGAILNATNKEWQKDSNRAYQYYQDTRIDEHIKSDKNFGGFVGFVLWNAVIGEGNNIADVRLIENLTSGDLTLDELDENLYTTKKTTYGNIITPNVQLNPFVKTVVKKAKAIYNQKKTQNAYPDAKERTWFAISEAVRSKPAETAFKKISTHLRDELPDMQYKMMAHPENVKVTRGQQLEVDIPEDDVLLDEDKVLANQPSANLIRPILEDWLPGGLLYDFVRRANKKGFENFRKAHNLKEKDLDEFHENVIEQAQETMFGSNPKMPESGKLLIDYLMENLKGDDFYIALAESIQDSYIELKSGEVIGEEKDYDSAPQKSVMGVKDMSAELVRDASLFLNDQGIKGITYRGGIDGRGFVIFSDEAIQTLRRMDDELPIYYQGRAKPNGFYDPELQAIVLSKNWNETTLVHEFHHRYLEKIWGIYRQAMDGTKQVTPEWLEDTRRLFEMLEIDPNQESITVPQQERFASMVEAYITGLGTENTENIAFQQFMHWVPEKYLSIMNIGYLDENNVVQNPFLDEQSIAFFNRWFGSPIAPSLPSAPDAQRMVNATDNNGEILPANQKTMNNREKDWGQDSEEQNKADAQLWRAIGENTPSDMRAALDGEEEIMKAEGKALPNDRLLPTPPKQTLRERWLKTRQPNARETAAEAARKYVAENPDHARELAFADPETMVEYDAPVDHGMLIRAVMETVAKGSDEWYILDNNLAIIKSMSGSTLALSGDLSHQAYLDAKREIEAARELKAAVNYAGTREGAMEKWNQDIREFIAKRAGAIIATTPDSAEREVAIKAFIEEAKTKFSGNTTNAILNQLDLTGYKTTDSRAFIKWAEKQIKQAAHAHIDTKEQAELMKASIAAQVALQGINSTETKDGKYVRAVQSAKDIRHWQFVKNKMKKAYIGRWGKFGIFMDNLFGSYAPSAMLMSVNTLFFANVPSTAINAGIISQTVKLIGDNNVDENLQKNERERIRQVFNASGINLAQMEKPTSPSMLHGEKYTTEEQAHWYNFTFNILGREDNWFRIPRFVDALARIATKNAKGNKAKADALFQEYAKLDNKNEEAQLARKQALAVANMAVFTQDGMMASALNHIRSQLNTLSRGILGLEPGGFGLGNILAPFLKTGANVIEMGLTASLAPVRTLATGLKILQGKEIPDMKKIALATDWVYFAFTAVAVAILAAISGDDDKWYEEPYQPGRKYDPNKPYDSIRIGNVWIKLDIFGPFEIPLRTAAKMVQDWEKKKTGAIASGLAFGGLEALGEMPLANQITDSPIEYISKYPDRWAQGFVYNQLNKLIPAQIKTVSRAASRATGTTVSTDWAGKTIDRKFHRNYGLDGERLTTNDLINILTNRLKYNPQ